MQYSPIGWHNAILMTLIIALIWQIFLQVNGIYVSLFYKYCLTI